MYLFKNNIASCADLQGKRAPHLYALIDLAYPCKNVIIYENFFQMHFAEFEIWNLESGVLNLELEIRNLELGVRNLESGI